MNHGTLNHAVIRVCNREQENLDYKECIYCSKTDGFQKMIRIG